MEDWFEKYTLYSVYPSTIPAEGIPVKHMDALIYYQKMCDHFRPSKTDKGLADLRERFRRAGR